ncbi:rRNA maturation RNase YbeY [Helcococcus bovis]|uniref:Endoribonuclease YbeY n=2 Tax=Peptoniphilaceae TaxID=1570339 RepID=A0ABW9F7Q4_9FIRM
MQILIDNQNDLIRLNEELENKIEQALVETLKNTGYGTDYEISISVVDAEEIKQLNAEYRGNDNVTDVLSFPLFEREYIPEEGMLGDIVICSERVKEQAKEFGHSEEREFVYLAVHSMLHLLGYDHMEEDEKIEMRSKEKEIMKNLGIFK